jgi:hypothetical protein
MLCMQNGFYVLDDPLEFLICRAEKARMDYLQEPQRVLLRKGCVRCRGNIGFHGFPKKTASEILYRRRMSSTKGRLAGYGGKLALRKEKNNQGISGF